MAKARMCLVLNVWTPAMQRWFAASGDAFGCMVGGFGIRADRFQHSVGTELTFVCVATWWYSPSIIACHTLGFANFSGLSPDFAASGDVGMLDIVHALSNGYAQISLNLAATRITVMIFGQSGGGRKWRTLLAMPSAKGLFIAL